MHFYELHEGDNDTFADLLLVREEEMDPEEFFELVQTIRRRIQDAYEGDTLIEAIASELERDYEFITVSDDRLHGRGERVAGTTTRTSSRTSTNPRTAWTTSRSWRASRPAIPGSTRSRRRSAMAPFRRRAATVAASTATAGRAASTDVTGWSGAASTGVSG